MSNERNYHPIGHAPFLPRGGLLLNTATKPVDLSLGYEIRDNRGNTFRLIKAAEALVEGDVVTQVAEGQWDSTIVTDGAVAAGDTKIHIDTNTSALTVNQYAGYFLTQATAASKGKSYQIKGHPAIDASSEMDVQLEDPASEAIADGTALILFHPYLYEKTDGAAEVIKGVAIGSISSGYYGWVQVGGYFQAVKAGHSTSAAIVINEPLTPIAANAGAVQGMAGGDEADIMEAAKSGLLGLRAIAQNTTGFITAISKGIL